MALPKIDVPVYELKLPLSNSVIKFRPFLVKEQKNLLMALEADDPETIEKNIKQILINCTLTDIDIDNLPIVDIEYYFLNLRARSVGEIVDLRYKCNNEVDGNLCNNIMETQLNIFDIKLKDIPENDDVIQMSEQIYVKLNYPKFSVIKNITNNGDSVDIALKMIVDCIDYIYDGEQYYYASDTTKEELVEFVESLNQSQFNKLEQFFDNIPKLDKKIDMTCSKCGFQHTVYVEGLENFFD